MKLKHTPGPWISIINNYCSADLKGCFVLADGVKIAEVSARNINSQTICEANAHLIAAAPELYECLEGIVSSLQCGAPDALIIREEIKLARAALAKARGETP